MKLALVQGRSGAAGLVVKLANSIDELLTIPFHFNPNYSPPRIYKVSDTAARDETGAMVIDEIKSATKRREFKTLKVPL